MSRSKKPAGANVPDPADRLAFLIWHLSQTLNGRAEHLLSDLGLTLGQNAALAVLAVQPGLSSAELSRRGGVTAQTMGKAVDSLVERGLVRRQPHPTHGRKIELWVTPEGIDLARHAHELLTRLEDELLLRLSGPEREQARELITRMVTQISPDALRREGR